MDIQGIQKLTLLDYPGKVACTVFLGGCDLRCPFCHNAGLLEGPMPAELDSQGLLAFLQKRRGLLDGVCVTGGEPLLRPGLTDLLARIRELGFRAIGPWLAGARRYFLQAFVDRDSVLRQGLHPCSREEMEAFAALVRPFIPGVELRGVD